MPVQEGAKIYADISDTDKVTLISAFDMDDFERRYPHIDTGDIVEANNPGPLNPDERYTYDAGTGTVRITADPDWLPEPSQEDRLIALELAVF